MLLTEFARIQFLTFKRSSSWKRLGSLALREAEGREVEDFQNFQNFAFVRRLEMGLKFR